MIKTTVFIADDHAIVRDGLKHIINNHEDFIVIAEAADGNETVSKIEEKIPDILLLDISMPIFNGFQVIERVKQFMPPMKVIILSLHKNESYVSQAFRAGVHGYILKSSPAQELLIALQAVKDRGGFYLDPSISRFMINYYIENSSADQFNDWDGLTSRELEVLKLIAEGYKNYDIAKLLNVSIKTVESHRYNIMDKLDMHDKIELAKYAIRKGIIQV